MRTRERRMRKDVVGEVVKTSRSLKGARPWSIGYLIDLKKSLKKLIFFPWVLTRIMNRWSLLSQRSKSC